MAVDAGPLAGKVALLAGATGEVGAALARYLRARGVRLGVAVRRPRQVEKVSHELGSEGVLVGCVPSGDSEAAAGFVKGATDALGPIDALFCATGAFVSSTIGGDDSGELAGLLQANLQASASLARAVVGPMKRRRTGSLVFVGSAAVGTGGAGAVNYLASKAALHEWVRALAEELRGSGVRAAAVLPTTIDTPSNRAAMPDAAHSSWQSVDSVVRAMVDAAFAPRGAGPLYPVAQPG